MSICSKCGAKYPKSVRFCTADGTVLEEEAPAETDQVGKVLAGKYRLDAYLSKGGMGSVFRATHLMLEKQVALKVIKPELVGSSEFVRRFQREARAATSLNHPNIVGVYDLGQADDGTLYIAMEFVDGASLKDVIRRSGPMDPIRIVRIMRQILSALALAHRHHIVHRDLKPQNIMLTTDRDGNEIAKLVDFGIAKTFDDRTQLTATGFAIGTPQYMAPEQAAGTEVDGRSDLYSLGIILYEMLIAEVPFNDPSTPAILVKHLTEVPIRPSMRRTDVAVHRGLEDVAVRCLEKNPTNRFQTAEEVAQAIAAAVSLDGSAASVSEAATLPMSARHLSLEPTHTAAPAIDSSMAPTVVPPPRRPVPAAPTVLDPAPSMASMEGPTIPAAPTQATPPAPSVARPAASTVPPTPAAVPPATVAAAAAASAPSMAGVLGPVASSSPAPAPASAAAPLPAAVAPPPASMQQQAPVMKSGRSSLALGIGALAIVALAGMGFAIQKIVGSQSATESVHQSSLPQTPATPASESAPPQTTAPQSAASAAASADAAKPAETQPQPAARAASEPVRDPAPPTSPAAGATPASNPSPGSRAPATSARAQREAAAPASREIRQPAGSPAASRERTETAASTPVAPAAAPAAPQLPENPTVLVRCEGAAEVCGAVRDAFTTALERERMPLTSSAQRADVYIVVNATAVDGQAQQQFGTTFVVRNYAITVELEAPRLDSVPGAPPSRNFSADLRVGRERINENARLVAMDTVQKIRDFWTRRR